MANAEKQIVEAGPVTKVQVVAFGQATKRQIVTSRLAVRVIVAAGNSRKVI